MRPGSAPRTLAGALLPGCGLCPPCPRWLSLQPPRPPASDACRFSLHDYVASQMRAGSAPRAPHHPEGTRHSTPPDPLQVMLAARSMHRRMLAVCRDKRTLNDGLGIRKPSAPDIHPGNHIKLGFPGATPRAGVQGARPPLAAARAGQLLIARKNVQGWRPTLAAARAGQLLIARKNVQEWRPTLAARRAGERRTYR